MSQKEADRAIVLTKVKEKQITLKQGAREMHLSYPQAKRVWSRYKQEGLKGLISRKRGQKSNRGVPEDRKKEIMQIIFDNYSGCKPLFVSEKLKERHGITHCSEFIRRLMTEYNAWFPKEKKKNIHRSRKRREAEGELLQADASEHDWFEGRGPKCHLHLFIDDATSEMVGGWFELEETTRGYYKALESVLREKGRPLSLYTDKRSTFVSSQGGNKKTQFARAMEELGVNMITAHTPQAKGRIERAFKTLQERLIWEMRIRGVSTMEEANQYLPELLRELNRKYQKEALNPVPAYRPLSKTTTLRHILSTKEERTVSKNLEIQYKNQIHQIILPRNKKFSLIGAKVTIITTLDGELIFTYQGQQLKSTPFNEQSYEPKICVEKLLKQWKSRSYSKPAKHHPWRQGTKQLSA